MSSSLRAAIDSIWSIKSRTHAETGYWGSVDTTHAFCEPHYTVSSYIAEFHNTWSSLIHIAVGYYVYRKIRFDAYTRIAAIWLVIIGVGSVLFHGTMNYACQLLDELPMIGFMLTVMLARAKSNLLKDNKWLPMASWILCASVVGLYLSFNVYEIFLHGFTIIVVADTFLDLQIAMKQQNQKQLSPAKKTLAMRSRFGSLFWIAFGKLLWEIENRYCETYPWVYPLHLVWHFCSSLSAYNTMIGITIARLGDDEELPSGLVFFSTRTTTKQKGL